MQINLLKQQKIVRAELTELDREYLNTFNQTKMSRTPYKGDAETAENERECIFWLFGL